MIDVKYANKGVVIKMHRIVGEDGFDNTPTYTVLTNPQAVDKLIHQLQEARDSLVENLARSSEEGRQQLWESV